MQCLPSEYSAPGSIGKETCVKREACKVDDYTFEVTECVKERRFLKFKVKEPVICSLNLEGAVEQPPDVTVFCRGCGRGEFRNKDDACEACQEGFYQDIDNH